MASFDEAQYLEILSELDSCTQPWILAAYTEKEHPALSLEGVLGVMDWRLHGLLSNLIKRSTFTNGEVAMIPASKKLGAASLLVFHCGKSQANSAKVVDCLKKLKAKQVSIAATSFPTDFLKNLEQTLNKAGIEWQILGKTL